MITLEEIITQIGWVQERLDKIPKGGGYPEGMRLDDLKREVKLLASFCKALCKTLMEKEKTK